MHERLHLVTLVAALVLASSLLAQTTAINHTSVTPVEGESWISHLHKRFGETSMGRTWDLGPAPPGPGEKAPESATETIGRLPCVISDPSWF